MHKQLYLGALAALLLLAGCGSTDLGSILGDSTTQVAASEIRGTVDSVDLNSRSMVLSNVSTYRTNLNDGGFGSGSTARIFFDNNTTVTYQGKNYRPEDLERGDEVAARVDQSGNRLYAQSMTVLYDAAGTGTTAGISSNLRGTIRNVDTSRRTIDLDRGTYGNLVTVQYDTNTDVHFGGRTYRPEDLERGDEIDIAVRELSNGRLLAQNINVIRSMSGTTTGTNASSLRGTVQYVDSSRRTIELGQTNWTNRFNTGTGNSTGNSTGNTVVLQYDSNTAVEFGGRTYPPTNLERGDVIDVQVLNLSGGGLLAQKIFVVRDINTSF